jgi:hypothetical protein
MFWLVLQSHGTLSSDLIQCCVLPLQTCPIDTNVDVIHCFNESTCLYMYAYPPPAIMKEELKDKLHWFWSSRLACTCIRIPHLPLWKKNWKTSYTGSDLQLISLASPLYANFLHEFTFRQWNDYQTDQWI